jgi:RNA polymerase sigma-70 factor (ECF subfamily)
VYDQDLPAADKADAVRKLLESGNIEMAYQLAVESTRDSLFRYLKHLLRNEDATREVFQETYLRVFRSLRGFRGEARLKTWS